MKEELEYGFWYQFEKEEVHFLKRVEEYNGEPNIALACTQLDDKKEQAKIVEAWVNLLQSTQLPIKKCWFRTRISQKIFDALCNQRNLEALWIKWGLYPDISKLTNLANLQYLHLGGGVSITDISPVATLHKLRSFEADNLMGVHDYSSLVVLKNLVHLLIEGDPYSSMKRASLRYLSFLESMPQLQRLCLSMTSVEDHSYLPILKIRDLQYLDLPNTKDVNKDRELFKKFL